MNQVGNLVKSMVWIRDIERWLLSVSSVGQEVGLNFEILLDC